MKLLPNSSFNFRLNLGVETFQLVFRVCISYITINLYNKAAKKKWQTSKNAGFTFQYAAFFKECEFEISPITSGHRLTLEYSVLSDRLVDVPAPVNTAQEVETCERLLSAWIRSASIH